MYACLYEFSLTWSNTTRNLEAKHWDTFSFINLDFPNYCCFCLHNGFIIKSNGYVRAPLPPQAIPAIWWIWCTHSRYDLNNEYRMATWVFWAKVASVGVKGYLRTRRLYLRLKALLSLIFLSFWKLWEDVQQYRCMVFEFRWADR